MAGPAGVRNERKNPVTRFCLAIEEHRRTEAGRVRTAREMVDFFFPRADGTAKDRIFVHLPPEVRGPIVARWGIRGAKSALRDSDDKIRDVVLDALAAGDIDEAAFEQGVDAQTLIDWVPLTDWWTFWRTGKLTGVAIQKALAVARELALFDDRWFLQNVDGRGGRLKGTDTLCDTLSKDQIVAWIRKVHESGDGSPAGLVAALGWETVLSKTSQEALLFALDAFAKKVGLTGAPEAGAGMAGGGPTEMPRGDDAEVAVPEIPALDPGPLGAEPNVSAPWRGSGAAPAQSGTMLSADEPPISFREVDDGPRAQPPPVPPRKAVP